MENTSYQPLLRRCLDIMDQSAISYRAYLAAGKTYRTAIELRTHNEQATVALKELRSVGPPALLSAIDALLHHYETWTTKWIEWQLQHQPLPDDVFAFPNEVTFPRDAALELQDAFDRIA